MLSDLSKILPNPGRWREAGARLGFTRKPYPPRSERGSAMLESVEFAVGFAIT